MKYRPIYGIIALGLCAASVNTWARIKLITLPVREHIEIQLENEFTSIIEEERIVPLKQGLNSIDFSWHNSSIKPETIVFRVLSDEKLQANVLSVSFPPDESALTWQVSASATGSARVRISYAINRLDKQYHYLAQVSADESTMDLFQYLRVNNQSGEEFLDADINTGGKKNIKLPIGINETQEFLNHQFSGVPVDKTYTVNAAQLGYRNRSQDKLNVLMHYQIHNDSKHKLGTTPLSAGKYRIYQQDSKNSAVFIGEDWGQYTARDDKQKLFIGKAQDVVVKRIIERKKRQQRNGNLYNYDVLVNYKIENFKDTPVTLTIEESLAYLRNEVLAGRGISSGQQLIEWQIGDETSFKNKPVKEETSAQKLTYQVKLPARGRGHEPVRLERQLNIHFKNIW